MQQVESLPSPAGDSPDVPATQSPPEITLRAVLLGVVLSVILAAANAYLGLFAGMTVSASIPAAVISLAVLRALGHSNILENNIVQTSASAGESLAAGAIFTLPALVILGSWQTFNYWQTTLVTGLGGVLGVLFTIPLRRALIVENPLRYPEGVATAEVLRVGQRGAAGGKYIAWGGGVGALFKLGETGFRLWTGVAEAAGFVGGWLAYIGTNLSPALVGVGYIVGLNIALLVFLGGALNWLVAIPLLAQLRGVAEGASAAEVAGALWSRETRYLGVGAMVVGGLWALVRLRSSLASGIRSGLAAYRESRRGSGGGLPRTERDTPMPWVGGALVVAIIPLALLFAAFTRQPSIGLLMALLMLGAAFLFSAVAGYMAGLVGSSNNPISGVTIATLLLSALLLLALLGSESPVGPAAAILIGAVVACAAAIAGDNMQDLKAGRLVGATPFKQQIMQTVGTCSAAFVLAPILTLLLRAYGLGAPTAEHPDPLTAPQATLMAAVASGVFRGGLPWGMVGLGMALAVAVIGLDVWLERRGSEFRTPVLAVAVGIYLPLELSVAIFLGGLIAWAVRRGRARWEAKQPEATRAGFLEAASRGDRLGLLFAAGLITGEALVGIGLAIPIVATGNREALAFWGVRPVAWPGLVLLALVIYALYRVASRPVRAT